MDKLSFTDSDVTQQLFIKVSARIDSAKRLIQHTVNTEMIHTYWMIGKDIIEVEQEGQLRASYGKKYSKSYRLNFNKNTVKGLGSIHWSKHGSFTLNLAYLRTPRIPTQRVGNVKCLRLDLI